MLQPRRGRDARRSAIAARGSPRRRRVQSIRQSCDRRFQRRDDHPNIRQCTRRLERIVGDACNAQSLFDNGRIGPEPCMKATYSVEGRPTALNPSALVSVRVKPEMKRRCGAREINTREHQIASNRCGHRPRATSPRWQSLPDRAYSSNGYPRGQGKRA